MNNRDFLIELRKKSGMNRKVFCEYFDIPYRTVTDWEHGKRKMPEYLLRLMAYKLGIEKIVDEKTAAKIKSDKSKLKTG